MAGEVENRLKDNGITLPDAAAPAGSYVPTVQTGNLLFVSGQVPFGPDGKIQFVGKVGDDTDVETAQDAAKLCAINILAQVKAALGDLDRVVRCVKLTGFVNCTPDFTAHPTVINSASDLDGRRLWRCRAPCPRRCRQRRPAPGRGRGSRGHLRGRLSTRSNMADLDWLTARPVAHRGLHDPDRGPIENTLAAVRAAMAQDLSIEVDLQVSADGEAMVFHDHHLDRMTPESGPVFAKTADQLSDIAIIGTDETIPRLSDLLETVAGAVPLVLEVKSRWSTDLRIIDRIATLLANYDGPAAVMSFDPELVARCRKVMPNRPRGIIADGARNLAVWGHATTMERFGLRYFLHAPRTRPHFIAYDIRALPAFAPLIGKWLFGKPLLTWTVRNREHVDCGRRWADQLIFENLDPQSL